MGVPSRQDNYDGPIDEHEWKSEFASTRSGRNSPNLFAKLRKKLILTPPVRTLRSPRFTEEELDALTSDLPYKTNYTYAYSKIYDPSLPDHWEVPNLVGSASSGAFIEEHWSAASIARQAFYIIRLPFVLFLHVILFILDHLYRGTKLSTVTLWEYFVYCIKRSAKYLSSLTVRQSKSLSFAHKSSWAVFLSYISQFVSSVWTFVTIPYHKLSQRRALNQYNHVSIRDKLESEMQNRRSSPIYTRGRRVADNSLSPARVSARISQKQYAFRPLFSSSVSQENGGTDSPLTQQLNSFRSVKTRRSTTPKRGRPPTKASAEGISEDTPLSVYGLRSRNVERNTPEPTFETRNINFNESGSNSGKASRKGKKSTSIFSVFGNVLNQNSSENQSQFKVVKWILALLWLPFHAIYVLSHYAYNGIYNRVFAQQQNVVSKRVPDADFATPTKKLLMQYRTFANDANPNQTKTQFLERYSQQPSFFEIAPALFKTEDSFFEQIKSFGYLVLIDSLLLVPNFFLYLSKKARSIDYRYILVPLLILALAYFLFVLPFGKSEKPDDETKQLAIVRLGKGIGRSVGGFIGYIWNKIVNVVFEVYSFFAGTPNHISNVVGWIYNVLRTTVNRVFEGIVDLFGYGSNIFGGGYRIISGWTQSILISFYKGYSKGYEAAENGVYKTIDYFKSREEEIPVTHVDDEHEIHFEKEHDKHLKFHSNIYDDVASFLQLIRNTFYNGIDYVLTSVGHFYNVFQKWVTGTVSNAFNFVFESILSFFALLNKILYKVWQFIVGAADIYYQFWKWFWTPTPKKIIEYKPGDPIPADGSLDDLIDFNNIEVKEVEVPIIMPQPEVQIVELDKAAIIAEITEKLRSELSAQFQNELTLAIEKKYSAIIENLSSQNINIKNDYSDIEAIIRQMIYEYDADKTGQVDYALESAGASVISTRCSETYNSYSRLEKIWNIPLWYSTYGPRTVIQRNSKTLFPGECWSFKNDRGYLTVDLSHQIDISSVSYEHISKELAPGGNRHSAPKNFKIWAYRTVDDIKTRFLIGEYQYDLDGPQLQFFIAKNKPTFPVKIVELEITSNYGAEYTCLYRLRVHGKLNYSE